MSVFMFRVLFRRWECSLPFRAYCADTTGRLDIWIPTLLYTSVPWVQCLLHAPRGRDEAYSRRTRPDDIAITSGFTIGWNEVWTLSYA